ncbi:hypothetical protein CEXT_663791, partial [Caerostris extrusa]
RGRASEFRQLRHTTASWADMCPTIEWEEIFSGQRIDAKITSNGHLPVPKTVEEREADSQESPGAAGGRGEEAGAVRGSTQEQLCGNAAPPQW